MFLNVFATRLKINIRNKQAIGWSLLFSLALGTLFYAAFNSIYDNAKNTCVRVAVVESEDAALNSEMLKELEYEDGKKMLEVVEVQCDEAKELLKKDEDDKDKVKGIIDIRNVEDIKLILPHEKKIESAAFISSGGIEESILSSIVSVFRQYSSIVTETIKKDPTKLEEVLKSFEDETNELVENKSISGDNKDPYVSYFYSLITMMAMMAAMAGASVPESSQANQSPVGARVDVSPVNKSLYDLAGLLSAIVVQTSITLIGLVYLVFVLKINFGGDLRYVFLTAILSTILGVSLGFFIYQFGRISKKARENIIMTIILGGGFLSGLMIANMKTIVEMKCPIVNRINPSAVISDAFYALNMYGVGDRYYKSLIYIVGLTIFCIISGLIMSRRRSYASL